MRRLSVRTPESAAWRLVVICVALALLSGLLLFVGINFDWLVSPERPASVRTAFVQLGSLGLMVSAATAALLCLRPEQRRAVLAKLPTFVVTGAISLVAVFAAGELALRWIYPDGMSFASHYGPLVRRFEQDFHFNRFDGPSRGPEVLGPKPPGELRVMFQGDSITWGQGVKDETLLYTRRLLTQLRAVNPAFAAATLAQPGREIDGHLAQLLKWGEEIQPDLIVYQWNITDIELDKSDRPAPSRLWRQLFFHYRLLESSYLWFFLDYVLNVKLPSNVRSYENYIATRYAVGSDGWAQFTHLFHAWSAAARRLTPRVIVLLVPDVNQRIEFADFHDRLVELCRQEGIVALDLIPWYDVFRNDYSQSFATPFDGHPGARAHERMAEALYHMVEVTWPELLRPPSDRAEFSHVYSH